MIATALEKFVTSQPELLRDAQEQYRQLLTRSVTDMEFRRRLLDEPNAVMEEVTGTRISTFRFAFVEQHGVPTVILPDYVGADAELDENALESVSGGSEPCVLAMCFVGGMALGAWGTVQILKAVGA